MRIRLSYLYLFYSQYFIIQPCNQTSFYTSKDWLYKAIIDGEKPLYIFESRDDFKAYKL